MNGTYSPTSMASSEEESFSGLDTLHRSRRPRLLIPRPPASPSHPSIRQVQGRTFWCMQGTWREVLETRPRPKLPSSYLPRIFADDVPGLIDPRSPSLGSKPLINSNGFYARRLPDGAHDCAVWAFKWRDLDPSEIQKLKL